MDRRTSSEELARTTGVADPRLVVAPSFTADQRYAFVLAVAGGADRATAARECGVGFAVVQKAMIADAGLREAVETAEAEKWSLAEKGLHTALENEEPWAIRLVLKESAGLRDKWKPAAEKVTLEIDAGPGVERLAMLQATLEDRRRALQSGQVIDLDSEEPAH